MFASLRRGPAALLVLLALAPMAPAQEHGTPTAGPVPESATAHPEPAPPAAPTPPTPAPPTPAPATPAAVPRRGAETPNGALSLSLPEGWTARSLKSGVALEPPKSPLDETIVAACEPFPLNDLSDEARLEDLLARLKAGQLATFEDTPRPQREKVTLAAGAALVVTYRGTDDGGRPAALRVAILPREGRVAILTARLPWNRLSQRAGDLAALLASFAIVPAAEEAARRKRLLGAWQCASVPNYTLRFLANGTFEESREKNPASAARQPIITRGGTYDVVGREVRLRFEEGQPRSFIVEQERDGAFVSAGQSWTRTGS